MRKAERPASPPGAPLEGLRVLDLGRGLAGALTSVFLADYGAEVIRVEPEGGDPLRRHPAAPLWLRGRKSVILDLREQSGREQLRGLAAGCDVLVESFRPGRAEALGLGWDELSRANPGLVYTSITGFGRRGPYAQCKGYEGAVMARVGGLGHVAGLAPRPGPAFSSVPYASFGAAQTALQGTLAALYVRERTGRGQRVESSLVQGIAAHDPWDWFLRLVAERYPEAFKTAPPYSARGVPSSSFAFRLLVCVSKDGHWLQFSQTSEHLFREFMEALGLAWMYQDPRWRSAPDFESEPERERFWEIMLEAARQKTAAEWEEIFRQRPNVWAERFLTPREALDHPQLRHNGHVLELEDPALGRTLQLAPLVKIRSAPAPAPRPAPAPGQHTGEVLAALRAGQLRPAPSPRREAVPRAPLEGVTVLELGLWYAAPYGPAVLADYGARVIKLEPLAGDPIRSALPFPDAGGIKMLQGKESVALDLDRPEGREIVRRLAARADLVMMSYRAGVAERLGVDPASLRRENPRLVYLWAPGYGSDGPCGRKPAFAPTIGAASGVARLQAGPEIPQGADLSLERLKPASIRLGFAAQAPGNADGCSALGVATALLLGLLARERTGVAHELLTSMLGTTAWALSEHGIDYAGRAACRGPDAQLFGLSALYRLYPARESWLFLAAPDPREWPHLCRALASFADLAGDARFASPEARARHETELAQVLAGIFARRPAADWERELEACDVACAEVAAGPVARAVMDDPIAREAGFLAEVEHPSFGPHRRLGPLAELSLTPGRARPAPLVGQHTEAVLRELGYGALEIAALEAEGAIARAHPGATAGGAGG
jgi:crotonobetainyl-CoA:carnitine CoA-transferase CaiB-like acyl-CoA transferase